MRSIEFKASFDKTYRKLERTQKTKVTQAIKEFLSALESGAMPGGLGLKRLQDDDWEIRVDIRLRVCFRMKSDRVEFAVVGSHETIKNFLKNF